MKYEIPQKTLKAVLAFCSPELHREPLRYILLQDGYLYASDGHSAVRCNVRPLGMGVEPSVAHMEDVKQACKFAGASGKIIWSDEGLSVGDVHLSECKKEIPSMLALLPEGQVVDWSRSTSELTEPIGVDGKLLTRLAAVTKTVGTGPFALYFNGPREGFIVRSRDAEETWSFVLMPRCPV